VKGSRAPHSRTLLPALQMPGLRLRIWMQLIGRTDIDWKPKSTRVARFAPMHVYTVSM
jgi:hypothetical protein